MEYSIGEIIDQLCVVHIKMYHLVDAVETGNDPVQVGKDAQKLAALNRERSKLKNEVNRLLGEARQEVKV